MRRAGRAILVLTLAAGVPAHGQDQPLAVDHDDVTCMVAERHPLIEADITPAPSVQVGRVFFRSALGLQFYYVEMEMTGGRFVGTLPRPRPDAGPVVYFVEGLAVDYSQAQSGEIDARVVTAEDECSGRVAPSLPGNTTVQVFSSTGSTVVPPGFSGVSSVIPAAGTTTAAATGGGSLLATTAGKVLVGATAAGLVTAVVVTSPDEEPPPVSPSR